MGRCIQYTIYGMGQNNCHLQTPYITLWYNDVLSKCWYSRRECTTFTNFDCFLQKTNMLTMYMFMRWQNDAMLLMLAQSGHWTSRSVCNQICGLVTTFKALDIFGNDSKHERKDSLGNKQRRAVDSNQTLLETIPSEKKVNFFRLSREKLWIRRLQTINPMVWTSNKETTNKPFVLPSPFSIQPFSLSLIH